MNEELGRRHARKELAFFGRMGADISHEMRNVLSVIGEYAGLLDDLLTLAEKSKPLDHAKLKSVSASITKRVRQGTEVMERFSRFAHAADEETTSFNLTAFTSNMTALAQRHVTQAGCTLEAEVPDRALPVTNRPFCLQYAFFAALELVLQSVGEGELITVKLVTQASTAAISFSGTACGDGDKRSGRISELSVVANDLEGSVETSNADGVFSLVFAIPIK